MASLTTSKLELPDRKNLQFDPLFFPKTIAIIGASKNRLGGFKYYLADEYWGYQGQIYLINPNHTELVRCSVSIPILKILKFQNLSIWLLFRFRIL